MSPHCSDFLGKKISFSSESGTDPDASRARMSHPGYSGAWGELKSMCPLN